MRGERGQTGAEYLGVLVVIALILGLVGGPGRAIAGHAAHAVECIAAGGTCPAPAPAPAPPAAPGGDYPTQGTPIGEGRPIDVLPFPGSVAGTPLGAGASGSNKAGGIAVKATVTGSERRGQKVINAKGCPTIALSVSVDMELTGNLDAGSKTAGGSLEAKVGQGSTYTVNASPEQVEAMEGGGEAPNPLDPRTLAVGGGIVLSEETYAGWGMSAQYRGIVAASGVKDGTKAAVGVTRISDSTVRVSVGEEQFVEAASQLGLGIPGLNAGLWSTSRMGDGKLSQVDLDIATPEGWAAYQAFIASGQVPAAGGAGVADSATVDQQTWSDRSELGGQLGPLKATLLLQDSDGTYATEHHPDGSEKIALTSRNDDLTLVYQEATDPGGNTTKTYGLLLDDVDASTVAAYEAYQGKRGRDGGAGTLSAKVDFTEGDLMAVQQQVYQGIANANRNAAGGVLDGASPQQVEGYFDSLGENEQPGGMDYPNVADQTWMEQIALADTPEEIMAIVARSGNGNPDQALTFLNHITSAALWEDPAGTPGKTVPGSLVDLDGSQCR